MLFKCRRIQMTSQTRRYFLVVSKDYDCVLFLDLCERVHPFIFVMDV